MSSIIYNYLVGTFEDPAESLRKFIFDNWTSANTDNTKPKMYSPLGFDSSIASINTTKEHGHADWNIPKSGDFIRFTHFNTEEVDANSLSNNISRVYWNISVDVFSVNSFRLALFLQEIENIMFKQLTNTTNRINKTNGQPSAIASIRKQVFSWSPIGTYFETGIIRGKNTVIGCTIEKVLS